jgi:WD40 repeat protein
MEEKAKIVGTFLGHKGRSFDAKLNPFRSNEFLSCSEDGNCKIWNYQTKSCLSTLAHNKEAEVLRACYISPTMIASAGSDGKVCLWTEDQSNSSSFHHSQNGLLDHGEGSQIYVCEPDRSSEGKVLLTAAENELFLWDLETRTTMEKWNYFYEKDSNCFGGLSRNPNGLNYVFDAKWHPSNHNLIGIALSDSTMRLVDTRQPNNTMEVNIAIDIPEEEELKMSDGESGRKQNYLGHATSVSTVIMYRIHEDNFSLCACIYSFNGV